MRKFRVFLLGLLIACTPAQVQTVNTVVTDVVDAAQFTCIMLSGATSAQDVAVSCGIVKDITQITPGLLTFIDSLISQREQLKAANFAFDKPSMKWFKRVDSGL